MASLDRYTEAEAQEAAQWVAKHGPSNSWTATNGTAARMIGRLLEERKRLLAVIVGMQRCDGAED